MSLEEAFAEVPELAAWMAAHGRTDCRRRMLAALVAPLTDRDRAGVLFYEISVLLDQSCPGDTRRRLEVVREALVRELNR